jgi:hypothetical protein
MPMVSAMAMLRSLKTGTREHRDPRKLALHAVLVLAASLAVVLALAAAPAGAVVTTVGPAKVGLQPRETNFFFDGTLKGDGLGGPLFAVPSGSTFANPNGGAVLPADNTYAIYWDPTYHYHNDWAHVIDTFFQSMGADSGSLASVFAVDAQYTDAANQHAFYKSTFQGAYTDTDQYPTVGNCSDPAPLTGESHPDKEPDAITCLTNAQIQHELEVFIANHGLQKGMSTVFYLMTPPGVTVCLDGGKATGHCSDYTGTPAEESYQNSFCSYHSDISPTNEVIGDERTILYAVIPWTAGGLGDGHLAPADQVATEAYRCQDGGFDPSSKPIAKEKAKEAKIESQKEKEEKTKNPEEKKEQEKAEQKAAILEGPHQQEPNQVPCPSPDGFCDTGLADLIINQIAVEQQNIVTDPLLNAWQQQELPHNEATDECRNFFAPVLGGSVTANLETYAGSLYNQSLNGGNYYLNDAFNLAAQKLPYSGITCLPGIRLEPQFTAPNPVNSGEIVGFDGMESDITLNEGTAYTGTTPKETYVTYKWNFGDETPEVTGFAPGAPSLNSPETSPCEFPWKAPCAASTFHSYQYGETYNVTLTVTDTGGNTASVTEPITVVGPPRPSSTTPTGGPSGPGSGGPAAAPVTGAPQGPPAPTVTPTPAPVVTGFATSTSLKKVLSGGLAVRYTTNEQVAGSIQVLLDAATAKRLGIHGATATGLPKGTPRLIVVGTAVLVTTKAGQGTLKIKFSPRTAARLKHTHKLKLTLRLFARNASRQSPQTTTVLSTVVLNP